MKMRWRMSPQTFFILLTQALKPNWNHVVIYMDVQPGAGFYYLNLPIELDSKMAKGMMQLEDVPNAPNTTAVTGSA